MLCPNCFNEMNNGEVCSECGFNRKEYNLHYDDAYKSEYAPLTPGFLLNDRYIIGRVLSNGPQIVYLAFDNGMKSKVILKEYCRWDLYNRYGNGPEQNRFVLHPILYDGTYEMYKKAHDLSEPYKSEFKRKTVVLAKFRENKNLMRTENYFEENDAAYLVMEYAEGISLKKYMRQYGLAGHLTVEKANLLFLPLIETVINLHAGGVILGCIEPDNIIVTDDGILKLLEIENPVNDKDEGWNTDFRVSNPYIPVEQLAKSGKRASTDVYALCATYYYAVTNMHIPCALGRISFVYTFDGIPLAEDDIKPLLSFNDCSIWLELSKVIMKGLEPQPKYRYQTMTEFRDDFVRVIEAENERRMKEHQDYYKFIEKQEAIVREAGYRNPSKSLYVGDTICYGTYPQNGEVSDAVEWIILNIEDGKAILLSKYALITTGYCNPALTSLHEVEWENSLARKICGEFCENCFSERERKCLCKKSILQNGFGADCRDEVFLLSENEVIQYLPKEEQRRCEPSPNAVAAGASLGLTRDTEKLTAWWVLPECKLFDSNSYSCFKGEVYKGDIYPKAVSPGGEIWFHSRNIGHMNFTIRPAVMIDLFALTKFFF